MGLDHTTTAAKFGAVGLDLGPVGRIARLLIGAAMLAPMTYQLAVTRPSAGVLAESVFYFALALVVFTVAFYGLRGRVLSRMNPWIGTAIILTPVLIVLILDVGPAAFLTGLNYYVGLSLIIASIMGYGGCEVVAIPSLLFRQRYVVYCPYNVIDVVEKSVSDRRKVP